jgi:hypothetical protein
MREELAGPEECADDVRDLREAQRIIAALRRQVSELEEMSRPLANEFRILLDDQHAQMLETLYRLGELVEDQDVEWDVDEVFAELVLTAIEIRWDMVRLEMESEDRGPGGPNLAA